MENYESSIEYIGDLQVKRFAQKYGMSVKAARETIDRYLKNPNSLEFRPVLGIMLEETGVGPTFQSYSR